MGKRGNGQEAGSVGAQRVECDGLERCVDAPMWDFWRGKLRKTFVQPEKGVNLADDVGARPG